MLVEKTKSGLNIKNSIKAQLLMEIEFGMPKNKCAGFGICNIIATDNNHIIAKSDSRQSKAIITIFDNNYVELDFLKHSMTAFTYKLFFSKGVFLLQEDFSYHSSENQDLWFQLPQGEYYINENSTMIKITSYNRKITK